MSDETNELLRQILKAQLDSLIAYKEETKRAADFRITAVEMQKAARRRALIGLFAIVSGVLIMLFGGARQ
jgi:hypothetical protein